jgi:uncharacterized membrane protein YkvA (DUF1232 family)
VSHTAWIVLGVVVAVVAIVTVIFAVRMVYKLFAMRKMLGSLGAGGKFAFWGALAYTIFPIDILPDPIYLDDMAVLGGALWYLSRLVRKRESLQGAIPHARKVAEVAARRRAIR